MGQVVRLRKEEGAGEQKTDGLTLEHVLNDMRPWQIVAIIAAILLASAAFLTRLFTSFPL